MFALRANPDYVPGGVQNFWTRSPTNQGGQITAGAMDTSADNGAKSSSFSTWFFGNPGADSFGNAGVHGSLGNPGNPVADGKAGSIKEVAREIKVEGVKKSMVENWRKEELQLPKLFKFQQFTQFNDSY